MRNGGSLKFNELPKVSPPITAGSGSSPAPKYQGSFHSAMLLSGFAPSTVATRKILRKRKKIDQLEFQYSSLENSFSLDSECAPVPDGRGHSDCRHTLQAALVTGYFWISSEAVSAKKQK